jgi:hypothetical protein
VAKSYAVMLQQVVATFGVGSVGPLLRNQRVECEIAGVFRNPTLAPQQGFLTVLSKDLERQPLPLSR